jgi:hypothetical protein
MALHRDGLLTGRTVPISDALARNYAAAGEIWRAGRIDNRRSALAMNFLMDRSAENWARELARLRGLTGDCRTDTPITPTGGLSGRFQWSCERGQLRGELLLAPINPPTIQALRFAPAQ